MGHILFHNNTKDEEKKEFVEFRKKSVNENVVKSSLGISVCLSGWHVNGRVFVENNRRVTNAIKLHTLQACAHNGKQSKSNNGSGLLSFVTKLSHVSIKSYDSTARLICFSAFVWFGNVIFVDLLGKSDKKIKFLLEEAERNFIWSFNLKLLWCVKLVKFSLAVVLVGAFERFNF